MNSTQRTNQAINVLRDLVKACGNVAPLTSQVPMDTVQQMRQAMAFVAAYEKAQAELKLWGVEP